MLSLRQWTAIALVLAVTIAVSWPGTSPAAAAEVVAEAPGAVTDEVASDTSLATMGSETELSETPDKRRRRKKRRPPKKSPPPQQGAGTPKRGLILDAITDSTPLGPYTRERAKADFAPGNVGHWGRTHTAEVVSNPFGPGRALKITHPKQTSGSLQNDVLAGRVRFADYEELYLQYELAFGSGFLFTNPRGAEQVYGGKLPGLAGGVSGFAPSGCVKTSLATGFSARLMWGKGDHPENGVNSPLVAYLYYGGKDSRCGVRYGFSFNKSLQDKRYYKITQKVTMNAVGKDNGRVEAWVDGTKVLDQGGFQFRSNDKFAVNQLMFDTYFGGATPAWGHPRVETQYYRNIRIYTP